MEAEESNEEGQQVLSPTGMDSSATSQTMENGAAALTVLLTTVATPHGSNDDDDGGNKTPSWSTLSSHSVSQSSSIASSSLSFFSKSATPRQCEDGGRSERDDASSIASLVPTPEKQPRASLFSSPTATGKGDTPDSTALITSQAPSTGPGAPLPLPPTSATVKLRVTLTADARSLGSSSGTDAHIHQHPLALSTTSQLAASTPVAPKVVVSTHSVDEMTNQSSAPVAALAPPLARVASAVDDYGGGGSGEDAREIDGGEDDGSSLLGASDRGNGVERAGAGVEAPEKVEEDPGSPKGDFSAVSTGVELSRPHTRANEEERRSKEPSNLPRDSPPALFSPPDRLRCESSEGQPPSIGRLGGTSDTGRGRIEDETISNDVEEMWGGQYPPHLRSTQRSGATSEGDKRQDEATAAECREVGEHLGRLGHTSAHSHRQEIRDSDREENSRMSPRPAVASVSHGGHAVPMRGTFSQFAASLGAKSTSAVSVASPTSTHRHRASVRRSTPASSLIVMDPPVRIYTVDVPSTPLSLPPPSLVSASHDGDAAGEEARGDGQQTEIALRSSSPIDRNQSLRWPSADGWPDVIFPSSEDENENAAAPKDEGLRPSTQAQQQRGQTKSTLAKDHVEGKTTVVVSATGDVGQSLSLPPVAHTREASAAAGATPPLQTGKHPGSMRTEALPSTFSRPPPSTLVVKATRGGTSPTVRASTAEAAAISTAVSPPLVHPTSLGSSPPVPAALLPRKMLPSQRQSLSLRSSSSSSPRPPPRQTPPAPLSIMKNTEVASDLSGVHQTSLGTVGAGRIPTPPSLLVDTLERWSTTGGAVATRDGHDARRAGVGSTLAVTVEPQATPIVPPSSPTLPLPLLPLETANAAAAGRACDSSPLCTSLFTPMERAVGGLDYVKRVGSSGTLRSFTARHQRFSVSGMPGSVISEQTPLFMAQFEARRVSSQGFGGHDSNTVISNNNSERQEGAEAWRSYADSSRYDEYSDRGRSYSYSYSYSSGRPTDSMAQGSCSSATVAAPQSRDKRVGAAAAATAAVGAPEASSIELIRLTAYEEVTPVVGGGGNKLRWLHCGRRRRVTGGERTTRTEVRTVSDPVEDHKRGSFMELSHMPAGRPTGVSEPEGSVNSPAVTTQDERTHSTAGSGDHVGGWRGGGPGGDRAGGAIESDTSGIPREVGSVTEIPSNIDEYVGESAHESVGESAKDVTSRSSMRGTAGGEARRDEATETSSLLHDRSGEADGGGPIGASEAEGSVSPPVAAEAKDHRDGADGRRVSGGGGEGEGNESTGATISIALDPPMGHPMHSEAPPRLCSWDSEPPCAERTDCSPKAQVAEKMKAKYDEEAIAADEAAERIFRQVVHELTVHPPRQCVFIGVHGLRHWCSLMFCAQGEPRQGSAKRATAALSDELHDARDGNAQSSAPLMEDPRWIDVRLALYTHDGVDERLMAAGSVFTLPSNLAALQRCVGCSGGGAAVECVSACGYGRDSWSDLLVFQVPEVTSEGVAGGGQQTKGRAHASIVTTTAEETGEYSDDRSGNAGWAAPSNRASEWGAEGGSLLYSLNCRGALYVKLEQHAERWVPITDGYGRAATMATAPVAFSLGMHMPSSVPDAQQTVATAVPAEARPVDLATLSQPDEEDASQSSTECQTEPSSSSSLAVAAVSPPCLAGETKEARGSTHHPTLDAADVEDVHVLAAPVGGVDGGPAEPTRERLEEYWRPLAISPPLLPADLCQLQSDQPSLVTRLETTGEAALAAAACVEQPLPLLPCHLRWAQEPQPSSAAASESAPFEPSPNETLSSWAALGSAIKEYERVCRCTSTGGVSAETLSNFQSGTAVNNTTPRPLTVLWNTISSPLAEEHTGLQDARGVHLIAGPLQRCCGGGLSPPACVMETPTVCSVVVRCAAAILVAHGAADVPDCRYCPPTSVSVTGGCDGVLVERVATAGGDDTHGTPPVAHRAPVMQYDNLQFHAVLTRSTASSLLFTVHGVASPAKVFGFAVWTPFDTTSLAHVQSDSCRHSGDAGVGGGLTDMWLPLFAPARADAAPPAVASMQQQGASLPGTQPAVPSHLSMNQVHGTTGLLLVGWLHCDVEVMLLSSPAEAMAHQLWNGPKRSLSSLALAAAGEAERGRRGCMGRGIHMDDGSLVDLSVVRVVGLRPLATQFGMSLPPRPLRWDDPSTWGNDTTCACVYCEVVALRQGPQQGARHPAPRSVPHATGASAAPGSLGWGDSPGSAMHSGLGVMGFASGPNGQGRGVRRTPLSSSSREQGKERIAYGTRTGSSLTGTATNAVLPVTTPVLHTNHPSWQHTFRVGLASLSSLHLRVFDVCQHLSDGNSSGTDTTADKAGNGHMKAQRTRTPGRGATLLGTATVSHWLLRRLLNGPCGEGCTWLPLLWSPRTASKSVAALAAAPGKPHLRQRLSPAVCNGFVLIGWRRLPQTPAISRSLRTRESGSWYASVTRRLHHISACQPTGSAIPARSSLVMTPRRLQETSPCWYRPRIPPSTKADSVTAVASPYSCPQLQTGRDVAPWLQISHVRLQWVWLQHFLFMHGGQARLSLFSPTAQGETRLLTQYLLVPLCELAKPSVKGVCSGRSSRVHSRRRRDATGVYGAVLPAASLCGAFPSSNATALTEAVLCLPASPSVEVQLWWYPHDSVGIPASGGSNTPPRLIGRGEWRFPPDGADTGVQGLLAKTEKEAFGWVTSAQPTPMSEAGLVGPGDREEGKSTVGLAPLPIALSSSFFTPHEADLHVAPVYSTGLPQFMEGGVLTWRLMSLPRLACDNWGEGHSGSASPTPLESVARVTEPHGVLHHPSQSSSAARPSSTWVLPDIGTPTTVHIEVCNIINFDPTDGPCTNAAQATTAFQVAVSGTPCDGSSPEGASEASTAVNEVRCWLNPSETPPPDAPRLPCVFFPVSDSTLHGTDAGGNTCGVQQQMHQLPNFQTSWGRKAPLQQSQANASGLDCKGDAACSVMQGATVSRPLRAEIQWPPRRFGWVSDAPPSLSLWLMSPATFSRGTGTADITAGPATGANERVWGAVRLPRMDAFTKTSGVVWLPLFQSYAAPAPVAVVLGSAATTEDVIGKSSGGGDTAEQLGKTLPLTPSSTTGREESGVTAAHPPCAAVVVKHIGFAAIRYAHNMQRRSAVAATTGITTPSAVTPRVLLVRVGRLRQRFPACAAGRPAPSSSSFSSSPPVPFESHTPPSGAALSHCATAGIAVATAKNSTAFAAAATDVLSTDTSGGTHVLLGLGAYQVSIKVPDTGNGRDGRSQTSVTGRVAVFPLPQRDAGAERSHELRVQARVGTSSQLATKTMCLNLDGDEETPGEAQWVPLVVRRLYHHNAHGAGYSDQGESVVAEILLQWRVVDFDTAAVAPRLGFSPVSLQRLVREYVGGATGTSCTYAVFSTQPAAAQLNRSPPRHTSAEVQRRAPCSESSERRPREQDTLTAEMVSLGLSRVLRMICPQRPHCVYLILDQLCLQCTARQRMVWTALQQETAALSQEVLADGRQDSAASAPIPLRLEVQLRWPAEWGAVWHRTALGSPRLLPKTAEPGVAPSLFPAAASSGAAAGADSLSVWIDSGEGIFVERGTLTASADDESSAGVSGERLLSCASFTPLCLVLPSAQDIEHVLGEQGLAARFSLTFALFAALQRRGDDASLLERVSDVCVGTGRTPVVFPRSAQFGLTSLLPRPRSSSSSSSSTCVGALANATDVDAKGGAAPIPAFLSWRARVTESLPVPPKASSRFCVSPKAKSPEIGGEMSAAADGSRRRGHMSLRLFSSSTSSSAEDEAIKSDGGAEPTGYTAAPLMPRTPALARVTVTRIELCGVDVSLAHGAEQRHRRPILPATVTVAAAPTHERGGAATATLPVYQLLPRLCPLHPTVPSISMPAAATPSLSMERVSPAPSPLPHVPLQQQRYMWSTDVSLLAPASQLIFCVSVPDAVLRSARVEEAWLPPRSPVSESEQNDTGALSVDAHWQSRHTSPVDVVGKAAWELDLGLRMETARPSGGDGERAAATQTADGTRDVVLEVESLGRGHWLGRLWARVDVTFADQLMRNAASVFFNSRMTLSVRNCRGFIVGDVRLTYRVEETYARLRERAALLCKQRGRVPRRLREQMQEIRHIRRQLRQEQGLRRNKVLTSPSASSTAGVVRLTLASGEDNVGALSTFASKPFALPTATDLVHPERGVARSSSSPHAPLLCVSRDVSIARRTEDVTATAQLELCQASSGVVVAAGQMTLPLYPTQASWREDARQSPASTVTSPLSIRVSLDPCTVAEARAPCIHPLTPSAGAVDVTATWSVSPARGDTWLTCIYVKRTAGCEGETKLHRRLLLRWVYCFEASAYPETEHAVDMPLSLKPSSIVSDHDGKGVRCRRGCRHMVSDAPVHWSGRAMQLPRIGAVGATIKRVELLEVTPISCAELVSRGEEAAAQQSLPRCSPSTQDACVITQLGKHVWSVADELSFERKRLQSQDSGEDALLWLTCEGAPAAGGQRTTLVYEVLLGLYTSSSLARRAAQLLEQLGLPATDVEKPLARSESAGLRQHLHPCAGAKALLACDPTRVDKAFDSSSPLSVANSRFQVSPRSASGGGGSDGGLVMRTLTFSCGHSPPLPTPELGQVQAVTCRVVAVRRQGGRDAAVKPHQHPKCECEKGAADCAKSSIVVLDAGMATSLLQERRAPEDLPHITTVSAPFSSTQLTAVWSPTAGSSHSTVAAPCAAAVSQRSDTHHRAPEGRSPKVGAGLLRVVLPLAQPQQVLAPTGDEGAGDVASDSRVEMTTRLEEKQFRIEVAVRGRPWGTSADETEVTARYVSVPFCASDILGSSQRHCGCGGVASDSERKVAVAGGGNPLCISSARWLSRLTMHLAPTPAAEEASNRATREGGGEGRRAGPVAPQLSPTAVMEVTWSLDTLSLLQTRACAAGVVWASVKCHHCSTHRNRGHCVAYPQVPGGSFARTTDVTDDGDADGDADDASSGEVEMRQMEAYSAWSEFLVAQKSVEETRMSQAGLQRWRCAIVGIEVTGLELPSWRCTGLDSEDDVYDAGQHASLLAQLVLPLGTQSTAVDGVDAGRELEQGSGTTGHHRRRRRRNKSGLVVGVARTTVTRIDRSERLNTDAVPTSGGDGFVRDGASGTRSVATATLSITSPRPRRHRYTATFNPLSWSMAVTDMIDQATAAAAAEHGEKKQTATAAIGEAPAAGLTVWHLLALPPGSSSSASNRIGDHQGASQTTMRMVYGLGATQLARLLGEGALYLVQILTRWCRDAYTTEERDALLRAAALYPTQWMPLTPATPTVVGAQCDAYVRFKYAYSYHGPVLSVPKSLATMPPPPISAPPGLDDAVFCAQLDRVQLTYTSTGDTEANALTAEPYRHTGTSAAAAWISRLTLVMRACVTTENDIDGTLVHSREVARWCTRLAPMPCGSAPPTIEATRESDTVAPAAPVASSANPLPVQLRTAPAPVAVPALTSIPIPLAVPMPATIPPSENEGTGDGDRQRVAAAAAPSLVAEVVPLLPTTRSFCWQSPMQPEAMRSCDVAQLSTAVPVANATETTTTTSVEMVLLLPDGEAEGDVMASVGNQERIAVDGDGAFAGTVVGRGRVRLGSSNSSGVVWDVVEGRAESGWRLGAPLSVRLPVITEAALSRMGCDASTCAIPQGEGGRDESSSYTLLLDLLVFRAPSMAQVAALQALRSARDERRRRSLSLLQCTEKTLVALATAGHHHYEEVMDRSKAACALTAVQPWATLSSLSQKWMPRTPYQLLRVPPIVLRVDTFAVFDGIPASPARCVPIPSASGKTENGPMWPSQTLWTIPQRRVMRQSSSHKVAEDAACPSQASSESRPADGTCDGVVSVEMQAWLVDERTGEVRAPVWTLLSNGPPVLRGGGDSTRITPQPLSLASHPHAGRALLRDVQRLRLDWRSGGGGASQESVDTLSVLAGLVGCASVSYVAANGAACLWVSGGLRRCFGEDFLHSSHVVPRAQGTDVMCSSDRRTMRPSPPLLRSTAHHTSAGRRRFQPPPSTPASMVTTKAFSPSPSPRHNSCADSCRFDYTLDGWRFLSCSATGQATTPVWRWEAHDSLTRSSCTASPNLRSAPRLFHSATLVGDRIWLLGGWSSQAGATTLPSLLARLAEHRRCKVYGVTAHDSDSNVSSGRLSAAALAGWSPQSPDTCALSGHGDIDNTPPSTFLRWCEGVQSVQCLDDGSPAPLVDVPLSFSPQRNCVDQAGAESRRLDTSPRIACHVAVACGDRWVAVFGGLMPPSETDDGAPVTTSAVHVYDTVQGTWSAQFDSNTGDGQEEWPMARYGHCVTPVPGTGCVQQPRSYFIFGGAATTPSCRSHPVPPEQLLWIWTPAPDAGRPGSVCAVQDVSVHSTWRRVQLPPGPPAPLTCRFLSQLHAYSAVEVATAICGTAEPLKDGTTQPCDPGLISMVLCVAGGMTASLAPAQPNAPAAASGAYRAFCECVEPWFAHPAPDVVSVLLTCVCEHQRSVAAGREV